MTVDKIGLDKAVENKESEKTKIHIPETLDKNVDNLLYDLERRIKRGCKYGFVGYDWGFNYLKNGENRISHINNMLNGINPELYVLTGDSTTGKTTFCRNVMDELIKWNNLIDREERERRLHPKYEKGMLCLRSDPLNEIGCIYFSYEQGINELQIKTLSRYNEINGNSINRGRINDNQYRKIKDSFEYLKNLWKYQIIYPTEYDNTINDIEEISLSVKEKLNVNHLVIFIDYLQIMKPLIQGSDTRTSVENNISELRRLSRKHGFSVIAVSSIGRQASKTQKPSLKKGKESGGIEYTADVVMDLTYDVDSMKFVNTGDPIKHMFLTIVKNRNNGTLGKISFLFNPSYQDFSQNTGKNIKDYDPIEEDKKALGLFPKGEDND